MSKKVNIMADIGQDVYDAVVVPHKRNRSFTTLIETLLSGYYSNAYIRSYVDDAIEGIQHESNDVLNDIISNMHQGLANMGVLTEDMKATAQDGMDAFSKKAEEVKEEMKDIQAQEIKDIKEGMEELREQVRTQNEEILGMLKTLMMGGGATVLRMEKGKEESFDPFEVKVPEETIEVKEEYQDAFGADDDEDEVIINLTEDGDSPLVNAVEMVTEESSTMVEDFVEEEESTTSEEEANDILAGLLEGQMYSF